MLAIDLRRGCSGGAIILMMAASVLASMAV
jgi:hypothetical protein